MEKITITVKDQVVELDRTEYHHVLSQLEKISHRENIENTLELRDIPYTEEMLDHIADNLDDELWMDESYCDAYDNNVLGLADRYVSDLKEMLADNKLKFEKRQWARSELKKLEEIA